MAQSDDAPFAALRVLLLVTFAVLALMYWRERQRHVPLPDQPSPTSATAPAILAVPTPADRGIADAKVLIEVLTSSAGRCACDAETAFLGQAVADVEPNRLRVRFIDTETADGRWRVRELTGRTGGNGLAVNGQVEFNIDRPAAQGGPHTVHLIGCLDWTLSDIHAVVDRALRHAYGGHGLTLSRTEFEARVGAAMGRLREQALASRAGGSTSPAPVPTTR